LPNIAAGYFVAVRFVMPKKPVMHRTRLPDREREFSHRKAKISGRNSAISGDCILRPVRAFDGESI
jgi:hypothetical protein